MSRIATIASWVQGAMIIALVAWFAYITNQQAGENASLTQDNARLLNNVCTDLRYGFGQLAVNFSQRSTFEVEQPTTTAAGKLAHLQAKGWDATATSLLKHEWTACGTGKAGAVQRTPLHVLPTPTNDPRQAQVRARGLRGAREE